MAESRTAADWPRREYARRAEAGELAYQRCGACDAAVFYPRVACPACGADALEWRRSTGRGVVYSATTVHTRDRDPYNVALVDLEEGYRIMTRVDDAPLNADMPLGVPVVVRIARIGGEPVPVARLVKDDRA